MVPICPWGSLADLTQKSPVPPGGHRQRGARPHSTHDCTDVQLWSASARRGANFFPLVRKFFGHGRNGKRKGPGLAAFGRSPPPPAPLATYPQICRRCTLHRAACGRHSAHSRPRCATVPVPPAPPHTPPGSGQVCLSRSLCSASQLAHCLSPSCLSPLVVFHYHCVVRTPLIGALHVHAHAHVHVGEVLLVLSFIT